MGAERVGKQGICRTCRAVDRLPSGGTTGEIVPQGGPEDSCATYPCSKIGLKPWKSSVQSVSYRKIDPQILLRRRNALDQIMNRNIMLRMMAEVDANPSDRP